MSSPAVGVLALQGDCAPHAASLRSLGAAPREVRAPADLEFLARALRVDWLAPGRSREPLIEAARNAVVAQLSDAAAESDAAGSLDDEQPASRATPTRAAALMAATVRVRLMRGTPSVRFGCD